MRWFEPFTVPADLADVLTCRYAATTAGRHVLLPDGSMDLLWIAGAGLVLCGPDTHAWSFELAPGTDVVGLRFRPGAAAAVFGVAAIEVSDERVPVSALVGTRVERVVDERMASADTAAGRLDVLEQLVRRRRPDGPVDDTVGLAALVGADPAFGVDRLAGESGVSARQLRRRFDREVGYGPAFLARIARLQRFAHAAAAAPPGVGLAELAAGAGYADQSHLARDCRGLAGRTPRQLVDVLPRTSLAVTLGDVRSVQDDGRSGGRRWVA
ncbi:MAG: helix-turn-helix domain-containing protein [Ilumatobacteraceae bacterium]